MARLLESLINRPDQVKLEIESVELALLYFHTMEDWDMQKAKLTELDNTNTDCEDGKLTIDLGVLHPRYHRLLTRSIKICGTTYKQATCLDECKFVLYGCKIILPIDCDMCNNPCMKMDTCIDYFFIPDYKVTCDGVTGSWIWDTYAPLVREYAADYMRSRLDNTRFRWDTSKDDIILKGEIQ